MRAFLYSKGNICAASSTSYVQLLDLDVDCGCVKLKYHSNIVPMPLYTHTHTHTPQYICNNNNN